MKHRDDPVTVTELAEYYLRNRLAGDPPSFATVLEHAQAEGVRGDCLCVLLFGFLPPGLLFPPQVRRGDWEMIACIDAAARAAGISRTVEVY